MTDKAPICWALIPVKAPGEGKSRLAGVLDAQARSRLVEAMLTQVVEAARGSPAIERVCLVSDPTRRNGDGATVIQDAGGGLNPALEAAVMALPAPAPDRILIVAADLPDLSSPELTMMARVASNVIAIAPDRHGAGTNALSLPFAIAPEFRFHFGTGSYAAHRAEALRFGYTVETMLSEGLEKDIDEPADLADARSNFQEAF
ncbi:2-phospho-L-lactate guanylyltransferase [Novosphingobium sp. RD2P27]|uniref:2-phospho-L-lactate guanylyltransferase n=1 Tax=Novosphingobium kalidii TaxID=3230299 RepID=A0ABV2CZ14_9SPHN